jgi:Tol biopolymer transport system component
MQKALIIGSFLVFSCSVSTSSDAADNVATSGGATLTEFALVHEAYVDDNWELFVSRADGSQSHNLTNTPDQHELYPQASPNGKHICFVSDTGTGRQTVRSVWVMDIDGSHRRKVADYARQPCWSPDSRTIAYLPQEFKKFNIVDYFTKGLTYCDVASGQQRPHPNNGVLHHLYNPCFSANGKWIAATVHAGMGHDHASLLIEADGPRIIDLGVHGCRPCLSPDGKHIAWGEDDYTIAVAELDVNSADPHLGERRFAVHDSKNKLYHVDWSPDGRYLSISRGPNGKGDPRKPGTHEAACEMVGVYAKTWDLIVVPFGDKDKLELNHSQPSDFIAVTKNGHSNKESDWFRIAK